MPSRRLVLGSAAAAAAVAVLPDSARSSPAEVELPIANGRRPFVKYPQKRPLIRLTARPPQLETPLAVLGASAITPNDAFFVRYHLSDLPTDIDASTHRLIIDGHVERPLSLSVDALRRDFPQVEIVAVNQCSGNSRGFVEPRVAGGQLGHGAMGNARWKGVPLKALLDRAGIRPGARQITFGGADRPPADGVPDFVKALDVDHARNNEVLVAWAMNGEALPFLNGYPLRLVVPGYYGTYWVKHLDHVTVLDTVFDGYWMKTAYRVPDNDCACVPPGTAATATRPIGRLNVRSFITSHADGAEVHGGATRLAGIAFDGGSGIASVEVSADDGASWRAASLGEDLGPFSFRSWSLPAALAHGTHVLRVRATSRNGETQPTEPRWQPSGYMRNVVERVTLRVR